MITFISQNITLVNINNIAYILVGGVYLSHFLFNFAF